jgi:hypothetical protein
MIHPELHLTPHESLGDNPNLYICHTWTNSFRSLVQYIEEACLKLDQESVDQKEIIIWLDIFCLNQWDHSFMDSLFLTSLLPQGLIKIGRTLIVLSSGQHCSSSSADSTKTTVMRKNTLFSRTWCLWEIFLTSYHLFELHLSGPVEEIDHLRRTLHLTTTSSSLIDLISSSTTIESDHQDILKSLSYYFDQHKQEKRNPQQGDRELLDSLPHIEWFIYTLHSALIEWETTQEAAQCAARDFMSNQLENLSLETSSLPLSSLTSPIRPLPAPFPASDPMLESTQESPSSSSSSVGVDPTEGVVIEMGHERLLMFTCPYEDCQGTVTVSPNQVNCGVFRHGVYKTTGRPIGAHLSQAKCLELVHQSKVYGCARPFRIKKIAKVQPPAVAINPLPPSKEEKREGMNNKDPLPSQEREEGKMTEEVKEPDHGIGNGEKELGNKKGGKGKGGKEFHYYIERCGYI